VDELLSEKEQIEQMRGWWRENGTWIIAGVVLGIGAIFGFGAWKNSQVESRVEASVRFEALAEEVAENRLETAEAIAEDIYADYADSIYADQARLAMARLYMDQGRDQDAAETLRAMVSGSADPEMTMVARLRLAKVLLYQSKPEEVLDLLAGFDDSGFAARYAEAMGDAHLALGDVAAARSAYLAALDQPRATELVNQDILQMKLNDLPDDTVTSTLPESAPVDEINESMNEIDASTVDTPSADAAESATTEPDSASADASGADESEAAANEDVAEDAPETESEESVE